jgi:hypothetical protein
VARAAARDFQYEPFAQAAIARLEEQRLAALEQRHRRRPAARVTTGLVRELEALVADHPCASGYARS